MNLQKEVTKHLRELAVRIGVRYVGSPGNRAAAEYIRRKMDRTGRTALIVMEMQGKSIEWGRAPSSVLPRLAKSAKRGRTEEGARR